MPRIAGINTSFDTETVEAGAPAASSTITKILLGSGLITGTGFLLETGREAAEKYYTWIGGKFSSNSNPTSTSTSTSNPASTTK